MKRTIYILFALLLFLSCQRKSELSLERRHKVLIDNNNCDISFYYPEIIVDETIKSMSELNEILYRIVDYEHYSHNCNINKTEKNVIKGDYNVLFQTDSILSIEYLTFIENYRGNKFDTVYHSLVLNTELKQKNKWDLLWGTSPELFLPNFDRSKIKPFVIEYNKTANHPANILAYESGSNYVITWGMTKDKFIIYVGGEGEAHGYEKIEIQLSEIYK